MDYTKLPSNANAPEVKKPGEEAENGDAKEVKKVTTGKVTARKKPLGKKLVNLFISEDIPNIKDYILYEVLIPTIRTTVVDTIKNSTDMLFFGKVQGKNSGQKSYTSYSSYSRDDRPRYAKVARSFEVEDVMFETRSDAEEVLANLKDLIRRYRCASVADLYEASGVQGNGYTDRDWGWFNLDNVRVVNFRGDWVIDLPRPEDIK